MRNQNMNFKGKKLRLLFWMCRVMIWKVIKVRDCYVILLLEKFVFLSCIT